MSLFRLIGLLILSLAFLYACQGVDEAAAVLGEVPDTISVNFSQVTVSPEGRVEIESGRVETFDKADRTVFHQSAMREFNPEGDLILEGGADIIVITGDQDGSAEGGVHIRDVEGDSRLEAEKLIWDDSERLLDGEGRVTVESGDGLVVSGEGFSADTAREIYTFTEGVEGRLELDDEN